ncbi:type IV pilus assembly protein PilW [Acinetobacter marinus]|uniref:Type IV pilus assembly protein PilW n=1 Tax=Acinetobacter marinus TaxID=281375 RepID=A0A1G6KHS1_9GAMM|nr:PilW family protein [Acinetobacter marinus]SDC30378.1 type IV pilus assembly protein PilW [Acinetobacter marinus]
MFKQQTGFTLIELMIALALGLVISAAAIMLFLTAQRSVAFQKGLSELQDNANFGLNYIVKDVRLLNLNASGAAMTDMSSGTGLVLTSSVNATKDASGIPQSNIFHTLTTGVGVNLLSRSQGQTAGTAPAWTGASNVQLVGTDADGNSTQTDILSDQLTIQYIPQYVLNDQGTATTADDVWVGGFDCEGNALNFRVENPGSSMPFGRQVVVQRYFLRADANAATNEPNAALALACEAGYYSVDLTTMPSLARTRIQGGAPSEALNTSTFGASAGQIVMSRIDHFHVLLGVENASSQLRYISIADYMALANPKPRIMSFQLGLLSRSMQQVSPDGVINDDQTYRVLDQVVSLKSAPANAPRYVRQVVSQTVAVRNGFGNRGDS